MSFSGSGQAVTQNTLTVSGNTFKDNSVSVCFKPVLAQQADGVLGSEFAYLGTWNKPSGSPSCPAQYSKPNLAIWQVTGVNGAGGGLAFYNLLTIRVRNSTFEGNSASLSGGGLWMVGINNTETSISGCT